MQNWRTERVRVHREESVALELSKFELNGLWHQDAMLEKYHA